MNIDDLEPEEFKPKEFDPKELEKIYLTDGEYVEMLFRMRDAIGDGMHLNRKDSEFAGGFRGTRSVECTWGLCNKQAHIWREPRLHVHPRLFKTYGQVSPKHRRAKRHKCPLDSRSFAELTIATCYNTCRVFKEDEEFTINQVVKLYMDTISDFEDIRQHEVHDENTNG